MKLWILLFFALLGVAPASPRCSAEPVDASVKDAFMAGKTAAHGLSDPGYNVWGFKVLRWTDGKIFLYYISNKVGGRFEKDENGPYPSQEWMKKNRQSILRSTQCIGVAVADNPAGPFVRAKEPVVEPHGIFKNIAVNPAALWRDGRFVIIIKGNDVGHKNWFRIQLVGHGKKPEGPFTFQKKPVFDKVQTEDACLWFDESEERYNMVSHVMG